MNRGTAPKTKQRRLIEIAAPERGDAAFSKGIAAQVAAVRRWWADASLGEDRSFTIAEPENLHNIYDLRKFLDEQRPEDAAYDEALVVYVTGHGVSRPSDDHFLLLRDSDEERLPATAFQTADLITRVLDSDADHVLVMVDSCFSGVLRKDLLRRVQALSDTRRRLKSLVVISSANEEGTPHPEQFTRFLETVVSHLKDKKSGFAAPHLSFEEFFGAMTALYEEGVAPEVQFLWPENSLPSRKDHHQPSPCLPNPGYESPSALVGKARSAVAWSAADLDSYWLSRASGQPSHGDPGWYFTGRTSHVRRMIEFLEGAGGTLVVTGEAGSGKSALLARVVTLSDPMFRSDERYRPFIEAMPSDLLVPEGAVDAAVLARNTNAIELTAALYQALTGETPADGREATALDQLLDHVLDAVRERCRRVTIVVDGIDEATAPARIITDVIRPLADLYTDDGQPAVRMLLGVRSAHASAAGRLRPSQDRASDLLNLLVRSTDAEEPLRTDTGTAEDIATYVSTLLRSLFGRSGPSTHPDAHQLKQLAAAIAEEVTPSFLDGRLAAEALQAQGRLPDPNNLQWRRTLRQGTQELLRQDLQEVLRSIDLPTELVVQTLRATAFAQGAGLPWAEVWPCAVQALSGSDVVAAPDAVIRRIRESRLAGYLTTGTEDGRFVYRPIHERISEVLRESPHRLAEGEALPDASAAEAAGRVAHRKLAAAFSALQENKEGPPHPYLRRHLVQHAAAGDVLNDRVVTEKFLPYETSGNVRGALGLLSEQATDTAHLFAWARIEPFLADAPPAARAESLRFSTWEQGAVAPSSSGHTVSRAVAMLVPRWKDLAVPGNVLARPEAGVCSMVSFTLKDGTPLIAVGGVDGTVRVWDPSTVTAVGPPIKGPGPFARALAAVPGPRGEPLLAVGCDSGAWTCDPLSGRTAPLPITAPVHALASFTGQDGTARLAVGTFFGLVLCDPLAGTVEADVDESGALAGAVDALAVLSLSDGRTLLAAHRGDKVDVLDAGSLEPVYAVPLSGERVCALAMLEGRDGSPMLAVTTRASGTVRFWDALTGTERRHRTIRQAAAVLMPYRQPGSDTLLALGADDGAVQLWDPETGEETSRFPADHTDAVKGLAVVPGHDGVPVLVSGSLDRTVRVWNPEVWARRVVPSFLSADGTFLAVLPGSAGTAELLSVGSDRNLVVRSADTGRVLRSIDLPYADVDGPVTALTAHTPSDGSETIVIAGLPDGTVGCWSGTWRLLDAWTFQEDHATALTVFADGARTILVVGTSRGAVAYCDLATGEVLGWLHGTGDTGGPVHALAYLPFTSGGVLAVASDEGVGLCRPFHEPHDTWPGQIGPVQSLAACPTEEGEWRLAAGGADGGVRLWAPDASGEEPFTLSARHDGPVSSLGVVLSPVGSPLIVSAGLSDTTVRLWDPGTGEEMLRLVTAASLTSLCVLPSHADPATAQPLIAFGGPAGIAAVALGLPQGEEKPVGQGRSR